MRELSVYYCPECGRYGYYQLSENAICPLCNVRMNPLEIHYQDFVNLNSSQRNDLITSTVENKIINELIHRIDTLENENTQLKDTVSWMHDTIWDLLRKNKELTKKLKL